MNEINTLQQVPLDVVPLILEFFISPKVVSEWRNKKFGEKDDDGDWFFVTRVLPFLRLLGPTLYQPIINVAKPSVLSFHRLLWSDKNAMFLRVQYDEYNKKHNTQKQLPTDHISFTVPEREEILRKALQMQSRAFQWLNDMFFAERQILPATVFHNVKILDLSNMKPKFLIQYDLKQFDSIHFVSADHFLEYVNSKMIENQPLFNILKKCSSLEILLLAELQECRFLHNVNLVGQSNIARVNESIFCSKDFSIQAKRCLLSSHLIETMKSICPKLYFLDVSSSAQQTQFHWLQYLGITIANHRIISATGLSYFINNSTNALEDYRKQLGSYYAAAKRHMLGTTLVRRRAVDDIAHIVEYRHNYNGKPMGVYKFKYDTTRDDCLRDCQGRSIRSVRPSITTVSETANLFDFLDFKNQVPLIEFKYESWFKIRGEKLTSEALTVVNTSGLSLLDRVFQERGTNEQLVQRCLECGIKVTRRTLDYLNNYFRKNCDYGQYTKFCELVFQFDEPLVELFKEALLPDSKIVEQRLDRHANSKTRDRTLAGYCITKKFTELLIQAYTRYLNNIQCHSHEISDRIWKLLFDVNHTSLKYNILHHVVGVKAHQSRAIEFCQFFWWLVKQEGSQPEEQNLHNWKNVLNRSAIDDLAHKRPQLYNQLMRSHSSEYLLI